MKYFFLGLITIYQKTLSFDHGLLKFFHPYGFCSYYPSCSEYTFRAVDQKGTIKGLSLGLVRILKCNPFHAPEFSPTPAKDFNRPYSPHAW